jgi:hypothetical protein
MKPSVNQDAARSAKKRKPALHPVLGLILYALTGVQATL